MTLNDEYLLIIQYSLSGSYNSLFRTEVIECNVFKGKHIWTFLLICNVELSD